MVPLLTTFAKLNQRVAAATSLAAIVPTAIVGSIAYLVAGEIDLVAGLFISIGAVVGAIAGSALLKRIPLFWLRWMFIAFILLVAVRLILVAPERGNSLQFSALVALGYVGLGGGIVAVPALVGLFAISDLVAKGTSLVVMIPTSAIGTVANWRASTVDVRAGLLIGVAATAASIPGAALSLALPARLSGILFALLLVAVAAQLTYKAVKAPKNARQTGARTNLAGKE